jgi:hypothetical protein
MKNNLIKITALKATIIFIHVSGNAGIVTASGQSLQKVFEGAFTPLENATECSRVLLGSSPEEDTVFNSDGTVSVRIALEDPGRGQGVGVLQAYVMKKAYNDWLTKKLVKLDEPKFLKNHTMDSILPQYHSFGERFGLINRIGYMRTLVEKNETLDGLDVESQTQLSTSSNNPNDNEIVELNTYSLKITDEEIHFSVEQLYSENDKRVNENYRKSGYRKNLNCVIERL